MFTLDEHYNGNFFGEYWKVCLIKIKYFATVRTRKLWYTERQHFSV